MELCFYGRMPVVCGVAGRNAERKLFNLRLTGEGVYIARSILQGINLHPMSFLNDCEKGPVPSGARKAKPQSESTIQQSHFGKLYPNPNDGNMTLDYCLQDGKTALLNIYDITGQKINAIELKQGCDKLKISEKLLSNGVYYYNVIIGNEKILSDKLIIIKQ